ncbi:MAG: insulinase family protein [Cyanobacteria bacterium CRU_2_1]|nr:insulinase family protein [Cyanobacteria bacterium RU_5_0]NJR57604.1 insulinase family protein [Cyanobacteria bacterium CRU_2_1]
MPVSQLATHSLQSRTVHRAILNNGMVVSVVENPAADIIAARLFIRAGGRYEPPEQASISHLWAAVVTKGTDRLSSQEIAERVESVGASLGTDSTADYCLLSIKTVSVDFAEILKLSAEMLRSPSFPDAEVELERRLTLQSIRSMQEQPFAVANNQLRRAIYQHHPYALPSLGTEETVVTLDRAALQHYHQTYFRPDNMVISITGRITLEEAIALVDQGFGDWHSAYANGHPLPLPSQILPELTSRPNRVVTVQETQQAIVMLGYLTNSIQSPDHTALKLLNTYLGNGLSSRLFVELREKRGLAYEVSAFYPTRIDPSHFVVYMGTAPENAAIAQDGLRYEVDRLCTTLLAPDELQATKNKILGQYALGKQTNAQIAQIFGWYETLGLGIDYDDRFQEQVTALTAEELQQVANRYFGEPYISLVGPDVAVELLETAIAG